jgi:hypothetical protein
MSIESRRGTREKKRKKNAFYNLEKSVCLFLLFYNYSFASAVQRRIEELKLALP